MEKPKKIIPIIGWYDSPAWKWFAIITAILTAIGWSLFVDKAFGAEPSQAVPAQVIAPTTDLQQMKPPDDMVNYNWHPPKSKPLPKHTVRWVSKRGYVHHTRGHQLCKKTQYLVIATKYSPAKCVGKKAVKKERKAIVKCAGFIVIGYVWGETGNWKALGAAASGCAWDYLS